MSKSEKVSFLVGGGSDSSSTESIPSKMESETQKETELFKKM